MHGFSYIFAWPSLAFRLVTGVFDSDSVFLSPYPDTGALASFSQRWPDDVGYPSENYAWTLVERLDEWTPFPPHGHVFVLGFDDLLSVVNVNLGF